MKNNQIGRSMIEMLGVLAIIAVLSVGGIAGYGKAIEQFKVNRLIEEYWYSYIEKICETCAPKKDIYRCNMIIFF